MIGDSIAQGLYEQAVLDGAYVTAEQDTGVCRSEVSMIENHVSRAVEVGCLLYTSDAADDRISVDLGGRRIIKKIFFKQKTAYEIRLSLVGSEMCIRDSQLAAEREVRQFICDRRFNCPGLV